MLKAKKSFYQSKRAIIGLFLLFGITKSHSQFIYKDVKIDLIKPTSYNTNRLSFQDSLIDINFTPGEYFWDISVKNKSNNKVSINWNASQFQGSKVLFDYTNRASKDVSIPIDELLPTTQLEKKIFPYNNFGIGNNIDKIIDKSVIKKRSTGKLIQGKYAEVYSIILDILIDEKDQPYKFYFGTTLN